MASLSNNIPEQKYYILPSLKKSMPEPQAMPQADPAAAAPGMEAPKKGGMMKMLIGVVIVLVVGYFVVTRLL
tara:strand:+ start:2076 stop:2291 length:216 start_codon:yes stop_codon:yes gene_type:complete